MQETNQKADPCCSMSTRKMAAGAFQEPGIQPLMRPKQSQPQGGSKYKHNTEHLPSAPPSRGLHVKHTSVKRRDLPLVELSLALQVPFACTSYLHVLHNST